MLAGDEVTAIWEAKFRPQVGVWCEVCNCRVFGLESEVGRELFEVGGLG